LKGSLLIIGGDGLIGRNLATYGRQQCTPVLATVLTDEAVPGVSLHFDLTRDPWPELPKCDAAVICAAITNQDQCRRDPVGSRDVNVVRTARLARQLAAVGTFVVFISSNQVFDGSRPRRRADEPVCPKTEYGRQKAEAEAAVLNLGDRCAVVRLTKVFFRELAILNSWRAELKANRAIHPFSDYFCSPVPLTFVTESIWRVAESQSGGIWHVSASEDVSYADIAWRLAKQGGYDINLVCPTKAPPGSVEHLPNFTTLDATRLEETFHLKTPSMEHILESAWG